MISSKEQRLKKIKRVSKEHQLKRTTEPKNRSEHNKKKKLLGGIIKTPSCVHPPLLAAPKWTQEGLLSVSIEQIKRT